jgi:hypothetical protein
MEAEAAPAPAAPAAATPSASKKKPKTHWSGVERGCSFNLTLSDVPGAKGSKVKVTVALRRNPEDGLTESVEPGWTFKAKGACCSLLCPHGAARSSAHSVSVWRQGRRMARMAAVAATTRTTSRWRPALRKLLR